MDASLLYRILVSRISVGTAFIHTSESAVCRRQILTYNTPALKKYNIYNGRRPIT